MHTNWLYPRQACQEAMYNPFIWSTSVSKSSIWDMLYDSFPSIQKNNLIMNSDMYIW